MFRDPQVNFYVHDVETSVRFYVDLFGFEETFRTPSSGAPEHVELRLGGLILGLASVESALGTHGLTTGGGNPRAEVCVWTDDADWPSPMSSSVAHSRSVSRTRFLAVGCGRRGLPIPMATRSRSSPITIQRRR